MMTLAIGIVLGAGALAWVLYPLFAAPRGREAPAPAPGGSAPLQDLPGELDPAEAAVRRIRAIRRNCPRCGPRPEPDPSFCSSCGDYLRGNCPGCGAAVTDPTSRFCPSCGASLAV